MALNTSVSLETPASDIPCDSSRLNIFKKQRFCFTKRQRLLNSTAYTQVFNDAPIRASHPCFLLLCRSNSIQARLGLVIAKKHVKRANQRNRLKRLIRESFRLQQHNIPAIDVIVLARKGADALTNAEVLVIINGLWKRITKRAITQQPN